MPVKVFIRNLFGQYLAGDGEEWSFTGESKKAHVFDYEQDDVARQLEMAQRDHGTIWVAVPLDPSLRKETCDICGRSIRSIEAHFDGTRFLCQGCRTAQVSGSK